MLRLNGGEGGGKFFPPTKDIGTREGDCLGKGKYFPMRLNIWSPDSEATVCFRFLKYYAEIL